MSNKIPALLLVVVLLISFTSNGQNSYMEMRKTPFRIAGNFTNREDSLQKEFESKGLEWPAKYVYIRSFKYDAQLEVWVKNTAKEKYRLFKTYKVCMQSGTLGPKRLQGDYQVPEGFYYINEFNTHSNYHLALGLNYPNTSDKILSDTFHPGGAIFIHGSCVSVGCIPVTDEDIEEIFLIASYAKANGEDFIPVHVFPFRYSSKSSMEYFKTASKNNPILRNFAMELKDAYDKFEDTHQVPLVLIDRQGDYVID